MIWKTLQLNKRTKESGNMILALFGAVALVGVLSAGTGIIINGPMKVMSQVNQGTQTESQIMVASKMVMLDVTNLTGTNGDCDGDRLSEPREWRDAAGAGPDGVADSNGGGFLPMAIGASKRDSWGTQYGYCVWDHGAVIDAAGCGGATQKRLEGFNSIDQPVIAIISAGKNKVFETPCRDFSNADNNSDGDIDDAGDDPLIAKGGDDILTIYSYAEAAEDNPGLWSLDLNASGEAVAVMDGSVANVDFQGSSAAFGGNLTLDGTKGLDIPDDATLIACDVTKEGQIRRNMTSTTPIIEICEDTGGAVYAWSSLATSTPVTTSDVAEAIADPVFDPNEANCTKNKGGPLQLVGTLNTPGSASGIWVDGEYIYVADGSVGGLRIYTFDGISFNEVTYYDTPGDAPNVWVDKRGYIYVADNFNGIHVFGFDGKTLVLLDSYPSPDQFVDIWGDETYIYIADDQGLRLETLYFDGTSFKPMAGGNGGRPQDVSGNNKYIFVAGRQNGLRAIEFNGSTNMLLGSINMPGTTVNRVWANNNQIFAADNIMNIASFTFDGTNFTQTGIVTLSNQIKDIWGDGQYVYVSNAGANPNGLKVFKTSGSNFIEVDSIDTTGAANRVTGDGTYIYIADGNSGIQVYSGYTCTEAYVPDKKEDYIGQITVTQTASTGDTLGSAGWAQTLSSDNHGDEAGIAFVIDKNASKAFMPTAAITAMRESNPSAAGLVFKTKASDGTINNRIYLASSGYLGVDVFPGDPNTIQSYLQIGEHDLDFDNNFQKGLLVTSSTLSPPNQIGYFGFYNDGTDTNTVMFSKTLKIKKTNVTGNALHEYLRFEQSKATTFFGNLEVRGDTQTVAIRNKSYSATNINGGDLNFKRKRINLADTDAIVQDNDTIGQIKFQGFDGSSIVKDSPKIISKVDGTPAAGNVPTDISFQMPQTNFDPEKANCAVNNGGPFALASTYDTTGAANGVWRDDNYIYVADWTGGVQAFTFDGSTFTLAGTYGAAVTALSIWGDGTYIYVADNNSGIHALTFDGSTFTLAGTYDTTGSAKNVWGDGTYIYVADSASGIHAFTFDGTNFTLIDTYNTGFSVWGVWGDGTYVYIADAMIHALTFDGSNFTLLDSYSSGTVTKNVWSDGTYIYGIFTGLDVRALSFDGTSFTLIDTYSGLTANPWDIWGDGTHIYVAARAQGVLALTFNGTTFTLADTYDTTGAAKSVWGDGTYVYIADSPSGIHAFSGFECSSELKITGNGDVAIQKTGTPEAKMHVGGRIIASEGITIGSEAAGGCGATTDEGTLRYVSGADDPLEVCDGTSWIKVSAAVPAATPSIDCSPIPFGLSDITDATASTEYTSNGFIVGGLDTGEQCYLSLSSDASSAKINLNGVDETSKIVPVQNGDVVKIKATSGTGNDCKKTYVSLGKQTNLFGVGVGTGCYGIVPFDPEAANCVANNGGPFTLAGSYNTTGASQKIWNDGTYTYVADFGGGLQAYSFDGTTFTLLDSDTTSVKADGIWGDGTYIYVADKDNGIYAYSFDGTTLTVEGSFLSTRGYGVWGDGTYIYLGGKDNGVYALTFDGSTFTQAGLYNTTDWAIDIWSDGSYIYVADHNTGLYALSFDGSTFTLKDIAAATDQTWAVWGDGTYIYTADGTAGVHAYTFDGTSFTLEDTYNSAGTANDVWSDGTSIYVADDTTGVHALAFDGTTFTLENTYNTAGIALGVWGYGTYLYVADDNSGIVALSGFECTLAN